VIGYPYLSNIFLQKILPSETIFFFPPRILESNPELDPKKSDPETNELFRIRNTIAYFAAWNISNCVALNMDLNCRVTDVVYQLIMGAIRFGGLAQCDHIAHT
jgi:hypothetical protein